MKVVVSVVVSIFLLSIVCNAVNLKHRELPPAPQICSPTIACTNSSYFCAYPEGLCGAEDAEGICIQTPFMCTKEYRPVCGCDGKTYGNRCTAYMVNMSVDYVGVCDAVNTCIRDSDCAHYEGSQYCQKPIGKCGGQGVCAGTPFVCTLEYNPVCGCDGFTYSNPCMAAANNVSISAMGDCTNKNDSCFSDQDCSQNPRAFCQYDFGSCKPPGKCTEAAEICPAVYSPVCACDGRVFSNSCYASAAYQSVAYNGACTTLTLNEEEN